MLLTLLPKWSPTGTPIVTLLAGDIGQSGLVPGRAPVHSDPDFSMSPGDIVAIRPPAGAPIGGGQYPEIPPLGLPAGGDGLWGSPKIFFRNFRHCLHNVVLHTFLFTSLRGTLRKFTPAMLRIAPPPLRRPVGVHFCHFCSKSGVCGTFRGFS